MMTDPGSDHLSPVAYGNLIAVHEPAGGVPAFAFTRGGREPLSPDTDGVRSKSDQCYFAASFSATLHQESEVMVDLRESRDG